MKHYIVLKVRNNYGVMSHIAGLFSRRGYNIDSIAVGETENPKVSTMTILVHGDKRVLEQIERQLFKLPDVIDIRILNYNNSITREYILITVSASSSKRMEVISICDVFKANIVDISSDHIIVEASGTVRKIKNLIQMLKPFGIIDIARTGQIALPFISNGEAS